MHRLVTHMICLTFVSTLQAESTAPADFPRFIVPGQEAAMETLRELYWQHYQPPAGPLATLWDEWMTGPTLWPAVTTVDRARQLRQRWSHVLSTRGIDPEGYVHTHQHASIAHQHGWPFPFWAQGGPGTWGWHFSLQGVPQGWHGTQEKDQAGWEFERGKDLGIADHAWNIEATEADTVVRTPKMKITRLQAPFLQLRWRAEGMGDAQPYVEWISEHEPEYAPRRRFHFAPIDKADGMARTMIPMYRSPNYVGDITQLAIHFDNPPGAKIGIQAFFTQYDTRHNINNPCFVRGGCHYFWWTRDINFLRENIQRMRLAMRYLMDDLGGREHKCIIAPFVGHDGLSGVTWTDDGKKVIRHGHGVGNNYWDLLPMGYEDAYATVQYYDTLRQMARLERELAGHPEWNIPAGPLRLDPDELIGHAEEVKSYAGQRFWNEETGRFVCGRDVKGRFYDFGYTFMNCEAIYYDFATPPQAETIMQWLTGERVVEGDTSQGDDIYHWRFAPRASTKRNIEWYGWYWNAPESIPFGDQVQDGGAVLGFSYHDLMARLKVLGPDDAWARLREIITWYDEVRTAGGYREYYKDGTRGRLQGGGTPGGLGCDKEFFESILVPQVVLHGFAGIEPRVDGIAVHPCLPGDWPHLTVTRIAIHDLVLSATVADDRITLACEGPAGGPFRVYPPEGRWSITSVSPDGKRSQVNAFEVSASAPAIPATFTPGSGVVMQYSEPRP